MERLFLDMDGTLAKFHDEANYLERMYEEGFFANLRPFENMIAGAKLFMKQHPEVPVFVISSCVDSPYCVQDKNRWLDEHLNIPMDQRIFPPMGASKADYIPGGVTKEDHLLDDYNKGLNQFMYDGGSAIKCHNNINQQGLGAHGGSAGNLWVGNMVHVDDPPEMIAAEIAQCMGLSYDLDAVLAAYPDPNFTPGNLAGSPLDQIRFMQGKEEFYSYQLKTLSGKDVFLPGHRLKAIALNTFQDADFKQFLKNDPFGAFHNSILSAIEMADTPMVGRVDYFDRTGELDYSRIFRSKEKMEASLKSCRKAGMNCRETWYVNTKPRALSKIKDVNKLIGRLEADFNLDSGYASKLATAIMLPAADRNQVQTDLLCSFWDTHKVDEPLQTFLGFSNSAWQVFKQIRDEAVPEQVPALSPAQDSLAAKISNAQQRTSSGNHSEHKSSHVR